MKTWILLRSYQGGRGFVGDVGKEWEPVWLWLSGGGCMHFKVGVWLGITLKELNKLPEMRASGQLPHGSFEIRRCMSVCNGGRTRRVRQC